MSPEGLVTSSYGPRVDYRNMENIPKDVAQRYKDQMNKLMQEAQKNIENRNNQSI